MPRCSNATVCIANFLTILIAVPLICIGLYLRTQDGAKCQNSIPWVVIATGAALLFLSLCGILGSCCRVNFFMFIYLFLMFLMIISVIISMCFSFVVTSKKVEKTVTGLKLGNSSNWLQKFATSKWDETEKCMKLTKMCNSRVFELIAKGDDTQTGRWLSKTDLYNELSPVQAGCCRPPPDCGFTRVNDTYWEAPKSGKFTSSNNDCKAWSNSQDGMCYSCESCKAGTVAGVRKNFRINAWVNVGTLVYLLIVYTLGCCAFHNNRADKYERA